MAKRVKGNAIDYSTGSIKRAVPTQEEIERSDSLRDETWKQIEAGMKGELGEEAMTELKATFYRVSGKYLFWHE